MDAYVYVGCPSGVTIITDFEPYHIRPTAEGPYTNAYLGIL